MSNAKDDKELKEEEEADDQGSLFLERPATRPP
jgi:hypothetical protein